MPRTKEVHRPTTRYRNGHRDSESRTGHAAQTTEWKRAQARARLEPDGVDTLIATIRAGVAVGDAASEVGVGVSYVYGRMGWDEEFETRVEDALAEMCGGEHCGTTRGYRDGGRCAVCREAKGADRGKRAPSAAQLARQPPRSWTAEQRREVASWLSARNATTTQGRLADELGVSQSTVSSLIRLVRTSSMALSAGAEHATSAGPVRAGA